MYIVYKRSTSSKSHLHRVLSLPSNYHSTQKKKKLVLLRLHTLGLKGKIWVWNDCYNLVTQKELLKSHSKIITLVNGSWSDINKFWSRNKLSFTKLVDAFNFMWLMRVWYFGKKHALIDPPCWWTGNVVLCWLASDVEYRDCMREWLL